MSELQQIRPATLVEEEVVVVEEEEAKESPKPAAKEEKEKATTKYYVLAGAGENGPYDLIGVVDAGGQQAAKKAGALAVNEKTGDASEKYFLAIPESSWLPKKPGSIKVETTITFD